MPMPDANFTSLSVDERLRLIETLWESIELSADDGDAEAIQAVQTWSGLDSGLVAELGREADEAEKEPAGQISWEDLLDELKRKYG